MSTMPPTSSPSGNPPSNYLLPAILTVFCCWPLSIVAIIKAAGVNEKYARGDVAGAMQASQEAKKWTWIAFIVGLVGIILFVILYIGMIVFVVSSAEFQAEMHDNRAEQMQNRVEQMNEDHNHHMELHD